WNASAPAKPQAPVQAERSSPASPSSVQISNNSSAPTSEVSTSGSTGLSRRRFHHQTAAAIGPANAASRPIPQTQPEAKRAPTGPQALGLPHGPRPGRGAS